MQENLHKVSEFDLIVISFRREFIRSERTYMI